MPLVARRAFVRPLLLAALVIATGVASFTGGNALGKLTIYCEPTQGAAAAAHPTTCHGPFEH